MILGRTVVVEIVVEVVVEVVEEVVEEVSGGAVVGVDVEVEGAEVEVEVRDGSGASVVVEGTVPEYPAVGSSSAQPSRRRGRSRQAGSRGAMISWWDLLQGSCLGAVAQRAMVARGWHQGAATTRMPAAGGLRCLASRP